MPAEETSHRPRVLADAALSVPAIAAPLTVATSPWLLAGVLNPPPRGDPPALEGVWAPERVWGPW